MKRTLIGLLTISLMFTPFLADALDTKDKDLLLYFSANDSNGKVVKDISKNKNDGEVVGTVKFDKGKLGDAMFFSEAGEIKAPHIALNDKSFTVSMWVKPERKGGDQQCVFSQTQVNAQNTSLHYRIYSGSGNVRMGFYGNDLDAPAAAEAGKWVHICFWLNVEKKSRKIYIDGKMAVEDAGKAGIAYKGAAGDTMVGSWGATGQKFNGAIDEVQLWDRALTEQEIKASMGDIATSVAPTDRLATTWGNIKEAR